MLYNSPIISLSLDRDRRHRPHMMKFVRPNRFFAYLEVQFEAVSAEQWVSSIPLKSLLARSVGPLSRSLLARSHDDRILASSDVRWRMSFKRCYVSWQWNGNDGEVECREGGLPLGERGRRRRG